MAVYDIPAMLQYALHTSGASSLRYVGHSQGTTVLLAALAGTAWSGRLPWDLGSAVDGGGRATRGPTLPSDLVERAALLAPVAVAKHMSSVPLLAMAALGTDDVRQLWRDILAPLTPHVRYLHIAAA